MSVKKIDITIPKMDYQIITVSLKEDGELKQLGENDLMFFTVREKAYSEDYVFQKTLEDGIEYDTDSQKYNITIESDDTKNMEESKEYGYDITIYYDGNKPKQKSVGKFMLSQKYTLNEVE